MSSSLYPYFSVIIPQKNRAEYLVHTLKTCMLQDYPNFEIIVSDDCSDDNSVEVVNDLIAADPRIKLYAHKQHMGMRDNFEFALSKVKPGYVMALGGDDALVPGCLWRMYEILTSSQRELLTWTPAGFTYPDVEGGKNFFYIKRQKQLGIKFIKSEDFLNKLSETFLYQIDECPMLFMKAVASTNLIDRVKSRTADGSFYYCATPAGEVDDYAFTSEPLSIGGSSVKSQGRNYQRNDEKSKSEANQFFKDNANRKMHHLLAGEAYSPLVTLMTADYLLTAQDLPGWPGKFKPISFEALIRASFKLMEGGTFENEVLIRELNILKAIARQHNLEPVFFDLLRKSKKKVFTLGEVYGFAITNSIRFEGTELGVQNIYDASLATNFVNRFYNRLSLRFLLNGFINSFKIVLRSKLHKKVKLPQIK